MRGPDEFDRGFLAMAKRQASALVVMEDAVLLARASRIADLAVRNGLPTVGFTELAAAGGLMAYGVNLPVLWHRAAVIVDRILKGAKPADLPIEQPTKFELVINRATSEN